MLATLCYSTMASSSCVSKKVDGDEIETIVVEGGPLGEHKGINVPGVELPTTGLTAKDIDDLAFWCARGRRLTLR